MTEPMTPKELLELAGFHYNRLDDLGHRELTADDLDDLSMQCEDGPEVTVGAHTLLSLISAARTSLDSSGEHQAWDEGLGYAMDYYGTSNPELYDCNPYPDSSASGAESMAGWVRCEDSMPEPFTLVQFAAVDVPGPTLGKFNGHRWMALFDLSTPGLRDYARGQVTHWAPLLPSPPKVTPCDRETHCLPEESENEEGTDGYQPGQSVWSEE